MSTGSNAAITVGSAGRAGWSGRRAPAPVVEEPEGGVVDGAAVDGGGSGAPVDGGGSKEGKAGTRRPGPRAGRAGGAPVVVVVVFDEEVAGRVDVVGLVVVVVGFGLVVFVVGGADVRAVVVVNLDVVVVVGA